MKIEITDLENAKILPKELRATGRSKKKEKADIAKKISTPKIKVPTPKAIKIAPKVKKVVAKVTKPATIKAKVVAAVKKVITKKKHGKKNRSKNR